MKQEENKQEENKQKENRQEINKQKEQKGKQYIVLRNWNGNLTASEYVARLAKLYRDKEIHKS